MLYFQIVHNYGHGANGISLAWGTSVDAAHLVPQSYLVHMLYFQVVHNYGHGANGISLAWGTAVDAAHLVLQSLGVKGNL